MMSLRYQITAAVTALAGLVLFLTLATTLSFSIRAMDREAARSRNFEIDLLADLARRPLLTGEYGEMQPYVERMFEHEHVTGVRVLDETGRVVAASDPAEIGSNAPLFPNGADGEWETRALANVAGPLGSVSIRFSSEARADVYAAARNAGGAIAVIGLLVIAFSGLLAGFLLTRRLGRTAQAALRLSGGDFSARVGARGGDEVAELGRAFDSMAEHIENQVQALQSSEERYRTLLDHMAHLVQVTSPNGEFLLTNRAWRETLGYGNGNGEDSSGLRFASLVRPEDRAEMGGILARVAAGGGTVRKRLVLTSSKGIEVVVAASFTPLHQHPSEQSVLAVMRDVTESERLAAEIEQKDELLRQGQRLESLGRLAGGVAHDFNNILTVIAGEAEELLSALGDENPLRESVLQVGLSVERAAALTRQLLTFARRDKTEPELLALNTIVRDLEPMLRRLIGEDLTLMVRLSEPSSNVRADAVQLQQVVVNLVVNARDAMPGGGTLTIETGSEVRPDEERAGAPRRYASLSVSDTGIGMDANTRERAFDPFFTTKQPGEGTGLGLSMIYGIVRQAGGLVEVHSEPREGSVFSILLPTSDESLPAKSESREPPLPQGRGETVLVTEDEDGVRAVIIASLLRAGYRPIEARTPAEALALAARERIDLVISDVVMPGFSGLELARRLRENHPELPILFVSGYAAGAGDFGDAMILAKPFTRRELLTRVRETLDRTSRDS